jgi:hypothetical protein
MAAPMSFCISIVRTTGFVLFALAFSFISKSQNRFAVFAGPQATTAKYTIADVKQPTEAKYGFAAGVGWKVAFENKLYFSPAAFYSLKGYKVKFNKYAFPPDTLATDNNTTLHTLELGFMLQFDFSNRPQHVFFKAGPSLDFQLVGKERFHKKNGDYIERDMKFSFTDYNRFGASFLFQLGYETQHGFLIAGQYTHGLGSINNADHGPQIRHRGYTIFLGKYLKTWQ